MLPVHNESKTSICLDMLSCSKRKGRNYLALYGFTVLIITHRVNYIPVEQNQQCETQKHCLEAILKC